MSQTISRDVNSDASPFFGADTEEVIMLRHLASVVVDYLNNEVDRAELAEAIYALGQVLHNRTAN